ncbi:MAG: thioesterase family protein [Ignavibacteriales bacterium]|nr:thioesterase family protein [Ignavibacteriales bacterium]
MPRAKLELPSKFHFSTEIPVRITDINYNDHLGNDAILSIIHEARVRFYKNYGFKELDVDGPGTIMSDAILVYKSESHYGDVLTVDIAVDDMQKKGFDFLYLITNKDTGKEVARAKTGIVFYDYENKRIVDMPARFRSLFGQA